MVKLKTQKPIDIRKSGLQNWRQLQQQNNAIQSGYDPEVAQYLNELDIKRPLRHMMNPEEAAPHVVQSPLYNTNTKLGESMFDEDVYSPEQFQNASDVRAENQPWYSQLGAGIGKMAGQAATAFIDGTLGLILGAGEGITGAIRGDSATDNWSKLFHNEISDAMYQANQAMEELMPNYKTSQEQNNEWYQNLGTMNFWADGLLKNMGFTMAAIYSGQAWNLGLKAAGLLKNASTLGAKIAGSLISAVNEGRVEANQNSTDKLKYDLAQINDTYAKRNQELLTAFETKKQSILNSDMSNNQKNANLLLLQEQQNREKLALDDTYNKLKQGAKDRANAAGIMDLALNIPILAINDFKTFGRVYANGFKAARQEAKNKGLGSLLGQTRRNANEAIIREESPLVNRIIRNADGSYSWKKIVAKDNLLNAGKIALREGNEEMAQQFAANTSGEYYSPDSPKAYYEAMRNSKSNLDTQNLMSSIVKGFASSYGDKSQWEQFAIGALNGLIGVPTFGRSANSTENTWLGRNKFIGISGGAIGEARSNSRINQEGQQVVDNMERLRADIQDKKKLMAQSQSFINAMNGYSNTNNRFEFNNHADNDTFNLFTSYLQAGREDDLKGLINQNYENFTDEQLEDIKGICDFVKSEWTDTNGELTEEGKNQMRAKLSERRDKLLTQFDNYKKALSVIKNTSDIPTEHQNEMAWLLWKANRFTERINEILNDKDNKNSVKNVLNGIEAYTTALRNEQSSLTGNETRTNEEGKEINILKENQEILKTWDNIYSILNGLYQGDVKAIATLANKDNEKAFKSLLSEDFYNTIAENYNVGYLNYMETMENLKDSWKLYDAYNTFNEKLKEYTENPSKIDSDHNKIDKEEEKLEESRDKNATLDKVARSKVSDLVKELSESVDFDAFDEAIDNSPLAEEAKSKVEEAKSIKNDYDKSLQELNKKLTDGKISQEEYNLAKQLLDNSLDVSESSDELLNFDSEAFNNTDDVEISPDELSQFKAENSTLSPEELQGAFEELRQVKLDKAKNTLSEVKTTLEEAKKFKESLPSAEEAKEIEDTKVISNDGVEEGKTIQEQQAENNQSNLEKNLKTSKAQLQLKDVDALTDSILAAEGINNPTIKDDLKRVINMIDNSIKDDLKNKHLDIKKMYNDISATQSYKNLQEIIPTINNYLNAIYQYRLNNAVEETKKETKKEAPLQVDNEIPKGEVDFTPTVSDNDLEKFIYNPRAVSINNGSIKSFWYPATTQFSRLRSREAVPYYQEETLSKEQKTRYQAIYEFLVNHNTFENLKALQKGSKVHFGFSKSLNEKVDDMIILILDENNNIVGDLTTAYDYNFNKIKGLKELYTIANSINVDSTDTNDIVQIPNVETTVSRKMVGRPNFTAKNDRMTINNIFNGKPSLFGIAMQDGEAQLVIEPGVTKNTARSDRELATMSPLDAKKGQPYILIETSDKMRKYYPVPFTMAKFDNRTINTKLGKAVQDVLNTIKDIKNDDDIVKVKDALQELLVIPVLHINLKDNILKIDIQRPTDEHIYTIYNGDINNPNLVTNILNNLKGGNTTFQVSRKYINTTYKGQSYNEMIGEIAETNLKQNATETVNDWFTLNPIIEGKETKAVNPKGLDMNPNKEDKNNFYLTDSNTGRIYFINLSSNKVYEQTTKGNIELGDKFNLTKAFIYCMANNNLTGIVHTPWGYYSTSTHQFIQKVTEESAAKIDEYISGYFEGANVDIQEDYPNLTKTMVDILANYQLGSGFLSEALAQKIIKIFEDTNASRGVTNYDTNNVFIGGEFGTGTFNITDGWRGVSEDPRVWSKDKTVPVFSEVKMKDGSVVTIISYRNEDKFGNNRGTNGIIINVKGKLTNWTKELIKENLTATQFKNSKAELTKQVLEILNSVSRAEGLSKTKSKVETKVNNLANKLDDNTLNIFDNIENALDNTQTKPAEPNIETKPSITTPTGPKNITTEDVLKTIKKATRKNASKKIKTLLEELKDNQEILNLINSTPGVKLNAQLAKLDASIHTNDSLEDKIAKIKSTFSGTIFNREAKEDTKYTKWNQKIEETKVYRMLPQLSREGVVNLVNSIKNMNGNSTIYGQFKNGVITISENASRGTLYHEAFHYVTQSLLSENELSNLYNQAKTKYGNLENIELEENMAEDFREYMQQEEGFTGVFVKTWRKLKNFINTIFNNQNTIDKLFYDISKGNYANRVSKEENYSREVRQYHNDKLMYGRLNEEQKNYIQERGISIKDYNNMSNEEKEILFRCM